MGVMTSWGVREKGMKWKGKMEKQEGAAAGIPLLQKRGNEGMGPIGHV